MRELKIAQFNHQPLRFNACFDTRQRNLSSRLLRLLIVGLIGSFSASWIADLSPKRILAESAGQSDSSSQNDFGNVLSSNPSGLPALAAASAYTTPVYSRVKTWGGSSAFVSASRLARDDAGNLYVVGEFQGTVDFDPDHLNPSAIVTSNNNTRDAFLSKFDANWNFQWIRTWGSGGKPGFTGMSRDAANGVALDSAGNIYVAGLYQGTVDFGSGFVFTSNGVYSNYLYNNIFVAKFNANGTTLWVHTWGGATGGEAYSIAVDKVNGFVYVQGDWSTVPLAGTVDFNQNDPAHPETHGFHGGYDAFLSKFDVEGNFKWARTWGGSGYDDGDSVAVDNSGNIYVCGMYGSTDINFDPDGSDAGKGYEHGPSSNVMRFVNVFLSKFDSTGKFLWVRTWGGLETEDAGGSVVTDSVGNVYAGGRFNCTNCNFNGDPKATPVFISTSGDQDGFVSKYDTNGTFVWARTWGGSNRENAGNLVVDQANDLYVAGLIGGVRDPKTFAYTAGDAYFAKLTSSGNTQWTRTWGGSGFDNVSGLVLDAADNVYMAGVFQSTVDFDPNAGVDNHTAFGTTDTFLTKFVMQPLTNVVYLPFIKSP